MSDGPADADDGPVRFMRQMTSVEYRVPPPSPLAREFGRRLADHEIIGHQCPACGLVYSPPTGFCPLCVVTTGDDDEVAVADRGTITTFTVITPIQYYGQEEREDYVLANILLDGADSTVGQQRLGGVANDDVRSGMRVKAVWKDEIDAAAARGFGAAIEHWEPSGEPDLDAEHFAEHLL